MVTEALEMEGRRVPGWRAGLMPFAKDVDGNFLASQDAVLLLIDVGRSINASIRIQQAPCSAYSLQTNGVRYAVASGLLLPRMRTVKLAKTLSSLPPCAPASMS